MKLFNDKRIIKNMVVIAIYVAAMLLIRSLPAENQSVQRFCTVVEIVLAILIVWRVISMIKFRGNFLTHGIKSFLSRVVIRLFERSQNKLREIYSQNRNRKFIKGSDESQFIFNSGILGKLKNKMKPRQKLDFRNSSKNTEKIRLLYIKLILMLIEKNYEIKYSHTPREIKNNFDHGESDILFDIYEQARYSNSSNEVISDGTVKLCESICNSI